MSLGLNGEADGMLVMKDMMGKMRSSNIILERLGNNPQRFEVYIRGNNPEGRELIRQASKNPIFRNLR